MNPFPPMNPSLRAIAMLALLLMAGCDRTPPANGAAALDEDASTEAVEFERGPHGGRLLRDGDFAVEISLVESGAEPELRAYATVAGRPVNAADLQLDVELHRFAGVVDRLQFAPRENYLAGTASVGEPHSFDVVVLARHQGRSHRWTYASYEGRTTIAADAATAAGIRVAAAGPGVVEEHIALYGSIQPDATRVRAIAARFPGAIRSIDVALGEHVRAGQRLAQVESNESLQTYAVTAPIAGIVTQRRGNPGETTDTAPLFEIADHSQVWAVLNVFPRDRGRIHIGQSVTVQAADGRTRGHGVVAALNAGGSAPASIAARVVLDNRNGEWAPGQFVDAQAAIAQVDAAVVVPVAALQRMRIGGRDGDAVFLNDGTDYQAQPVQPGRRDGERVEIVAGLAAGMPVVVANSYLLKADIEKSGASHDH